MLRVEDIREEFARLRKADQTVNGTIEIVGESFLANDESIFGRPNQDYIEREIAWYHSGSLNVNDIPGGAPRIWKHVADRDGFINSNYGYLLLGEENGFQFDNVVKHLLADPGTRRATAVYTRPSIHQDWKANGRSDFICTNAVQYLIRDGRANALVQMRSNDAIFGYRNDWAWQKHMLGVLVDDLKIQGLDVEVGDIIWQPVSLHIYERHFHLIDHYINTGDPFPEVS